MILALGLVNLYDRPEFARWITPTWMVIAALVVRYAIVGQRLAHAAAAQIPDEILEAAALDGAGGLRLIRHVLFPITRVAQFAILAISFVLTLGEIGSTILLYPPGGETLPIALYTIEANSPRSFTAALSLILSMLVLASIASLSLILWRPRERGDR
jgi:iron(III) transport system permease protein